MQFLPMAIQAAGSLYSAYQDNKNRKKSGQFQQVDRFTPEQNQAFKNYWDTPITGDATYQAGNKYIQNLLSGNPEAYAAFEAPLMRQFQEQTVPGIAERFAGMGTGAGAGGSSALYNSLAKAGSDFSTNIGALRSNLQMQALPQALQYAQQPYSNMLGGFGVNAFQNTMNQPQMGAANYLAELAPSALQNLFNRDWGFKGGTAPPVPAVSQSNSSPVPGFAQSNPFSGLSNFNQMNSQGFTYGG